MITIFTLFLAVATVCLAYSTYKLANHAKDDLEAQWRPFLAPVPGGVGLEGGRLQVIICNAGRGPALRILTQLERTPLGQEHPRRSSPSQDSTVRVLAPGTSHRLDFYGIDEAWDGSAQLLFDYVDLAERQYATAITVHTSSRGLNFYDLRSWRDVKVTTHGDLIYPQPGYTDVSPSSKPKLLERWRARKRS